VDCCRLFGVLLLASLSGCLYDLGMMDAAATAAAAAAAAKQINQLTGSTDELNRADSLAERGHCRMIKREITWTELED
jgi:hypothetical protein